jgi:hypothetical protein
MLPRPPMGNEAATMSPYNLLRKNRRL